MLTLFLSLPNIAIALAVGFIAYQQFLLARERFKLDLFEKRYSVFKAIEDYIEVILTYRNVSDDAWAKFLNETRTVLYVFDDDIVQLAKGLREKGVRLREVTAEIKEEDDEAEKTKLQAEKQHLVRAVFDVLMSMDATFAPYLKFKKWHKGFLWEFPYK